MTYNIPPRVVFQAYPRRQIPRQITLFSDQLHCVTLTTSDTNHGIIRFEGHFEGSPRRFITI